MSSLVKQYLNDEKLISFTTQKEMKNKTFDELLREYFDHYIGFSIQEIAKKLGVTLFITKNKNALLVSSILTITDANLNKIEKVSKLNMKFETVVAEISGFIRESISFENLDFDEVFLTIGKFPV